MATNSALIYELYLPFDGEEQKELTIGVLNFLEVPSIEERDETLVVYHDQRDFLDQIMAELDQMAPWIQTEEIQLKSRPNENWNKSWEESFDPIIIDNFCTIRASFHNNDFNTKHVITIDPEMAFGTGHHETTYSIIQLMERLEFKNKIVLDYGTGTGVLAILAEQLGGSSITAIDYDPVATECAKRCVVLNNGKKITCRTAEIEEIDVDVHYDIILANVNRNVLLQNGQHIRNHQKAGGNLLLSGLLIPDLRGIKSHYNTLGYKYIDHIERGEWVSVHLKL